MRISVLVRIARRLRGFWEAEEVQPIALIAIG
jgi:hypothetical protein